MSKPAAVLLCTFLLCPVSMQLRADPYVGYFTGQLQGRDYRVTIEQINSTTYDGILTVDDERMQLDARRFGESTSGLLRSHTEQFRFQGRLEGSVLILDIEDGRRLILGRSNPE